MIGIERHTDRNREIDRGSVVGIERQRDRQRECDRD